MEKTYSTGTFLQLDGDVTYSRYQIGLQIYRGAAVYLLKVLPPVGIPVPFFRVNFLSVITLVIGGLVLMIDIEAMETRLATAVRTGCGVLSDVQKGIWPTYRSVLAIVFRG